MVLAPAGAARREPGALATYSAAATVWRPSPQAAVAVVSAPAEWAVLSGAFPRPLNGADR